jgi:hypothetical protein
MFITIRKNRFRAKKKKNLENMYENRDRKSQIPVPTTELDEHYLGAYKYPFPNTQNIGTV